MIQPAPDLAQRLALAKFLTDLLKKLRADELLPRATAEMPSGSRLPVMFGGQHAGWASMPQPSKKAAYVSDEKALLAWAEKNHPAKVENVTTVNVDDDLIAFLADHYPSALEEGRQVQPAWLSDIKGALKDKGFYVTLTGEKLAEVPGITVPEPDPPAPRVDLSDDAQQIIGDAWRSGNIPVTDLLALPGGEGR
jgi:hypothetical protein